MKNSEIQERLFKCPIITGLKLISSQVVGGITYSNVLLANVWGEQIQLFDTLPISVDFLKEGAFQGLLEITDAEIFGLSKVGDISEPKNSKRGIQGNIIGVEPVYRFFEELIMLVESEDDFNENVFFEIAETLIGNYSKSGFNLEAYDHVALMEIQGQVCILNKFIFQDLLEDSDIFGQSCTLLIKKANLVNCKHL